MASAHSPSTVGEDPGSEDVRASDEVGERLLAAAAEVFADKGFDGAGVQEIARRAGLTTGAIYGRFTGKADLLARAVTRHSTGEFDRLFSDHRFAGGASDILATVGSHLVDRTHDDRRGALLLEAVVAARRHPDLADHIGGLLAERADRLAEVVTRAKAAGSISADVDTDAAVRFCQALGLGFLVFYALDADQPDAEPWHALITRLVAALGDGPSPT